ncbi:MAG TPA: UvrD-helicase domain-containing protein [Euzebyales bacterium]
MSAPVLDDPAPFDLAGPLPSGTVVLEASAGTGKTYTIAGLATRWVAETDARLPSLLIVTFTRAATAELRDRVRARLVEAADHLEAVLAGTATDTVDPVLVGLADGDDARVRLRHTRLARALIDVDAATIATIHGFCQHVLDGFGIASDLDRDAELVDDLYDLVEEVVDDLLVSTYVEQTDHPRIQRTALVELGRAVVGNPGTRLAPRAPNDPEAGFRLHLATEIRAEVTRRARQRRLLSYDGLLTQLDRTLRDHDLGPAAREALRRRYHVALIDEFQDTDPVQWSIVSQAFVDADGDGSNGRALVLIGDPKQAIYAFRGADVHAYLQASRQAHRRHTLGTSWRADAGLLDACAGLFAGATFGHEQIPFRPVGCAPGHDAPRLAGAPDPTPLRLRLVPRHPSLPVWSRNKPSASDVRELIAADVAADIVGLLDAAPQLVDRDRHGVETSRSPLRPRDVAVLVRTHSEAGLVQRALGAVDVPSVVGGAGSVFATPAATDWRRLLDALERPASANRVRTLALTNWIGWTADDLAHAEEAALDDLHEAVHRWARLLADHGVAVTVRTVELERGVAQRLLATDTGERLLADLDHIGELAHAAAAAEHLGPPGIAAWLRDRIAEASDESSDDRLRRLETDRDAVQISTIHGAKGLEFPVVYCPFLWSSSIRPGDTPVFHDEHGGRHLDVGGDHPDHASHKAAAERELQGEELRLMYVALTRAKHQVVLWYAPAGMPEWSGLGRLLLCRNGDGPITDMEAPIPDDDQATAAATRLAARADGTIAVETVPEHPSKAAWRTDRRADVNLDRARFTRSLDDGWRRTSYTALTRLDDPAPRVGSEPEESVKDDETAGPEPIDTADADPSGLRDVALPLADMPGGTHVGTFVHRVLEHTDFAAADLSSELAGVIDAELHRTRLDLDRDALAAGLHAAVRTPLGPAFGDLALRDVTWGDRRDEVGFELPLDGLAGDDRDTGAPAATIGDVLRLLRDHLPGDDPLVGYPDTVQDVLLPRSLRGYLNGAIDLVLRRDVDGAPVFHVVDYKTNWLGTVGVPLTAWDYRPAALVGAMAHGHYPIQALLYAVAVHRMLRWRLPGYDPCTHLGAIGYLFLRGMVGPDAPAPGGIPCGVFAWTPPAALVVAASDLLHGVAL